MSDGVSFIFRTLIKVPVVIFSSFLVFNLIMFTFAYSQALGISYVVMQTVAENNYLSGSQLQQINNTLADFNSIEYVQVNLIGGTTNSGNDYAYLDTNGNVIRVGGEEVSLDSNSSVKSKRQFGSSVICGIRYNYKMIWPLMSEDKTGDGGLSEDGRLTGDGAGMHQLEYNEELEEDGIDIVLAYKVPCLKYYPDI